MVFYLAKDEKLHSMLTVVLGNARSEHSLCISSNADIGLGRLRTLTLLFAFDTYCCSWQRQVRTNAHSLCISSNTDIGLGRLRTLTVLFIRCPKYSVVLRSSSNFASVACMHIHMPYPLFPPHLSPAV
jgi:hypothetical protein